MIRFITFLILLTLSSQGVSAQDKTVVLAESMFQTHQLIALAPMEGWVFKKGNDSSWAKTKINTSDWIPLKLSEINTDYEDESGRVEGWFRLKFKLDNTLKDISLGLNRQLWAATNVFINGELIHSFGNTGNPYQAYNPVLKYPTPILLNAGEEYVIAIHFVDYETTLTQREIRLKPENLKHFLNLTGPNYNTAVTRNYKRTHVYATLCISISFLLFFMFWLLVFLNPNQTIFKLIALMATIVFITAISFFYGTFSEISYTAEKIRYFIMINFQALMVIFGLMVLEWVLLNKITKISITLLIIVTITSDIAHLFSISFPFGIAFSALLIYFCYLLYTHRNIIKGGTLAVVASIVVPVATMVVYVNLHKFSLDLYNEYDKLINSITLLSGPLLLMIYIAMRFKEILKDVEAEARKVLRITEEKKELLADQNIRLENLVKERTSELNNSLENLKATQSQLIQSEKMASLGELTAGIAHEIQNPLNFVNNFSELNQELVDELDVELNKGDIEEAKAIAKDIKENESKINHHGKRADAIVKGMLQHSRKSSAEKEPTDINKLADEYLRLAYHGLRAKDQSFNATLETDFDESIGKVNVIPQDMGRVILNLIINAFYAVNEKNKQCQAEPRQNESIGLAVEALSKYKPTVSVTTKKNSPLGGSKEGVIISVKDNGNGIPKQVVNKIFQPFFTTKPTGEGTGLGLSMSYDIVTKGHGGDLKVETKEGEGTIFYINLPVTK